MGIKNIYILFLLLVLFEEICFSQVVADFSTYTSRSGCSPLNVVFKDQSTGNITYRKWIFGNGNSTSTGNQTMPSAIYGIAQKYTVTLIVSDGTNYDTIIKPDYITVFKNPLSDFTTTSANSGCNPLDVSFQDISTFIDGAITHWSWDFGDGTNSNVQNPTHTYLLPGSFPVSLHVIDQNGCYNVKVVNNYINVSETPIPEFEADQTIQCFAPMNVNFTNQSTGNGQLSYEWNFGNGENSTSANPNSTYNNFGSYDVSLIANDVNGCSDTLVKEDYINLADVVADFSTSQQIYCIDQSISFTNNSTDGCTYLWNFGDGTSDTTKNPTHSYSTYGDYTVQLIAFIPDNPCSDTIIKTITIERVEARFSLTPEKYCKLPLLVNFTDESINAASWEWDMGYDSTASPFNPIRITSTEQNPVKQFQRAHSQLDSLPYYFSRSVYLKVTSLNGCISSTRNDSALIVTIPKLNTYPKIISGCAPIEFSFIDSCTYNSSFDNIISRLWTLYDGSTNTQQNFNLTINDTGVYDFNLNIQTELGCSYNEQITLFLGNEQNPNFIIPETTSCASDEVLFFDNSSDTIYIDSYSWRFENEDTIVRAGGRSISIKFPDTGFFNLVYTVSHNGCRKSISLDNAIYIKGPLGSINHTFDCANPLDYVFNPKIIDATKWIWDFGDGIKDSVQTHPIHTYLSGDYEVNLELYNDLTGCSYMDSLYKIKPRELKAEINTDTLYGCPGLTVTFYADSVKDEIYFTYPPVYHSQSYYKKYLWDYDDGSFFYDYGNYEFSDTTVTHTFQNKGIYNTKLIVRDINGCKDTAYKTIKIYNPEPDFTTLSSAGCKPFSVDFSNITQSDTTLISWNWNLGNGITSNLENPSTIYNNTGSYNVTLEATNNIGCTNSIIKNGYINVLTSAPSFTVLDSTLCMNDSVYFINTTPGNNLSFLWDFGNGDTSTDVNPVYFYPDSGNYDISLKVVDTVGCDTTYIKYGFIKKQINPIADFVADTLNADCYPLIVSFSDNSGSAHSFSWIWDFGDGATSTQENPNHAFSHPGQFDIKMKVSTNFGCTDSITKQNFIIVKGPYADFSFESPTVCNGEPVAFYIDTLLDVDQFSWDFGDGIVVPGVGDTVYHTYYDFGFLYPQLIYSDSANTCPKFERDSITINLVRAGFVIDDSVYCETHNLSFINASIGENFYNWDFDDGTYSGTENPFHTFQNAGNYTVELTVFDSHGCTDTDTMNITVNPLPNYIPINDTLKCIFDTITLDAGLGFQNYLWNNNSTNQTLTVPLGGIFTVLVSTDKGCWSKKDTIVVTDIPVPIAELISDTTICADTVILLSTPDSLYFNYLWSTNQTSDTIIANPGFQYFVTVSNACGIATDSVFITKIPLPVVNLGIDTAICTGTSLMLYATGSQYDSYEWNDGSTADSLVADTIKKYYVTVTNSCATATDSFTLDLIPIPVLSFVDDTICEGDTIIIYAPFSIYNHYSWSTSETTDSISAIPGFEYSLIMSNACGEAKDTLFIEKIPLPVVNLGIDTAICTGTSLMLYATGSQYDTYEWNDGSTADSLVADTIKTYFVTVTNSCATATDSITLDLIPIPELSFVDDTICEGDTIIIYAPYSIYHNYLWNSGETTDSISAIPGFEYSLIMSNACGEAKDTLFIEKIPLPVVNLGIDTAICTGTSLMLYATGSHYDSYEWNDGSTADSLVADTIKTYYVTVSNFCATATDSITLDLIPIPNVQLGNDTLICEGTSWELDPGGSIYNTYIWNNDSTVQIQIVDTISYFSVTVTNVCGTSADSINIGLKPNPVISLGNDTTFCNNSNIEINWILGFANYIWDDDTTSQFITINQTDTISLVVRDSVGCFSNRDTIILTAVAPAIVNLGNDTTICFGDSLLLFADSIYDSYSWSNGAINDSIYINESGKYYVDVTNVCNTASDTMNLIVYNVEIDLGLDTILCPNDTIIIDAGQGFISYLWNNGDTTQTTTISSSGTYFVSVSNICVFKSDSVEVYYLPNYLKLGSDTAICEGNKVTFRPNEEFDSYLWHNGFDYPEFTTKKPGTYYLTAQNKCGIYTDTIVLTVTENPYVYLGPDLSVSYGTETLDAGDDAQTYLWSTGDTSRTIQVEAGNYTIWVDVFKDGCKSTDTIRISYYPDDTGCIFDVPNAFTPNNDGKNDILHVRGYCIDKLEFMIFNRFGEMVFKSEDINTGWDGTYKGRLQESEIYIWYLKVTQIDGQVVEKTGNVALIN